MNSNQTLDKQRNKQELDLKKILGSYQGDFEQELEDFFGNLPKYFEESFKLPKELLKKLIESTKYSVLDGGKRIRPILSLITAEAILQKKDLQLKENPALGLALAIELIHCGSLIHDDLPCMDDDDLRRGRASNHKKFGEATALLAGDLLMTLPNIVFLKLANNHIDASTLNKASLKLNQAINGMIFGQAIDIELTDNHEEHKDSIEEDLATMDSLKTGALLKASVEIAAILAGASEEQEKALTKYAENLGLAFQIADDVLDHTSSSEEMGKTIGKDEEQNKFTYVNKFGLEKSKKIAQKLIREAKNEIETIGIYPDKLNLVADYVISRTN